MMNVSGSTVLRFVELELIWYHQLAQKYARRMSRAEQALDPIDYREAERYWLQYEHYADAMQKLINDLKWHYGEVKSSD